MTRNNRKTRKASPCASVAEPGSLSGALHVLEPARGSQFSTLTVKVHSLVHPILIVCRYQGHGDSASRAFKIFEENSPERVETVQSNGRELDSKTLVDWSLNRKP